MDSTEEEMISEPQELKPVEVIAEQMKYICAEMYNIKTDVEFIKNELKIRKAKEDQKQKELETGYVSEWRIWK